MCSIKWRVLWRWLKFKYVRIDTQFFINNFQCFLGPTSHLGSVNLQFWSWIIDLVHYVNLNCEPILAAKESGLSGLDISRRENNCWLWRIKRSWKSYRNLSSRNFLCVIWCCCILKSLNIAWIPDVQWIRIPALALH